MIFFSQRVADPPQGFLYTWLYESLLTERLLEKEWRSLTGRRMMARRGGSENVRLGGTVVTVVSFLLMVMLARGVVAHEEADRDVSPPSSVEATPRGSFFKYVESTYIKESQFPFCSWQATTDESVYTPLLLDPNAVYQPLVLSFVASPHRIYRISSCFQQNDYFGYQSYTLVGEELDSLVDYHIKPTTGKNPFSDPTATPDTSGTYHVHVTRYGNRGGLLNEMKGCRQDPPPGVGDESSSSSGGKAHLTRANIAVVILRLYNARPPTQVWGGVDPPTVSYSDDDGVTWQSFGPCDDTNRLKFNNAMKSLGDKLYDQYSVLVSRFPAISARRCPLLEVPAADQPAMFPNIQAVSDRDVSEDFVAFSNADSAYAYWCTSKERLGANEDLIMTIQGTAPIIPDGLYRGLRIADVHAYELRYGSLETAELALPQPSYASLSFAMMADHYGPGWDRQYMVVASVSKYVAVACGLLQPDDPHVLFLPFSNKEVPAPPIFPAVIYREQLTRDKVLSSSSGDAVASGGGASTTTVTQMDTVAAVKTTCKAMGTCYDVSYVESQMGKHYPRLKTYVCDRSTRQVRPYEYVRKQEEEAAEEGWEGWGGWWWGGGSSSSGHNNRVLRGAPGDILASINDTTNTTMTSSADSSSNTP